MKRIEWLKTKEANDQITFIVQKAAKNESTGIYHDEYRTTPIFTTSEWLDNLLDDEYIIINADHPPIDVTGAWVNWYNKGQLQCAVITTETELLKRYGAEQTKSMLAWYDEKARK